MSNFNERIDWGFTPEKAREIDRRHKNSGETWEELCIEYMKEHNIQSDTTIDKNKEYFRRAIRREADKAYAQHGKPNTLASQIHSILAEPTYGDEEITIERIHELTSMSKKDFKLSGKIKTSVWGAMSVDEFDRSVQNGSIKLDWEIQDRLFDEKKLEEWLSLVKPNYVELEKVDEDEETLLVFPYFDAHFPIGTNKMYKGAKRRALKIISKNKASTVLFLIGQDLIHTNDNKGHTANLTPIGEIDLNRAIEEAVAFYVPQIAEALKYTKDVRLVYSKGNHDESISNPVARILHAMFPETTLDVSFDEYKLTTFGNVSIGYTHGDKVPKSTGYARLHDYYLAKYVDDFTMKNKRYILTGHYHKFQVVDENGTLVYTLATRKPDDTWHDERAFVGSQKFFTAFLFDKTSMTETYTI